MPQELYFNPVSKFVVGFIGSPSMNFLPAKLVVEGRSIFVELKDRTRLAIPEARRSGFASASGKDLTFGIRPEAISGSQERPGWVSFHANVELVEPLGSTNVVYFNVDGDICCACLDSEIPLQPAKCCRSPST